GRHQLSSLGGASRRRGQYHVGNIAALRHISADGRRVLTPARQQIAFVILDSGVGWNRFAVAQQQQALHATWYFARAPRSIAAATSLSMPSRRRSASSMRTSS